jgi:hypothetical protein
MGTFRNDGSFFTSEISADYSWRWERHAGEIVEKSLTSFVTFWDCAQSAAQAGFDANALHISRFNDSIVVEVPSKGGH